MVTLCPTLGEVKKTAIVEASMLLFVASRLNVTRNGFIVTCVIAGVILAVLK